MAETPSIRLNVRRLSHAKARQQAEAAEGKAGMIADYS
jgi:hypothetical protein